MSRLTALLLATLLGSSVAHAVPLTFTHQARLISAAGDPLTGEHQVTFALYADETGGSAVWSETATLPVADGYVSFELGSGEAIDPNLFDGSQLYLGLSVDGTQLGPRTRLISVPYAMHAQTAESATNDQDTLAVLSCADGEVAKYDGTTQEWACDNAGGAGGGALLGQWEFNEASGSSFADQSGAQVSLTAPGGGLASGSPGHSGNAITFTTGVLQAGNGNALADSPVVTIEAWVRPTGSASGSQTIATKVGAYTLSQEGTFPTFAVTAVSGTCTVTSPIAVSSSDWAHVEGWFNGRDVGVAVNGAHVTAECAKGPLVTTQGDDFLVGAATLAATNPYLGSVDELRVWGHASSQRTAFGDVYTRWGNNACPAGDTTIYTGVVFGGHHNHNNQGALCLAPNDAGPDSTSSGDILYPLSVDHNHGTNTPRIQILNCAVCMAPTSPCVTMAGTDACPAAFEQKYSGYFFGGHYSHAAGGGRFCVEDGVSGSGRQNSGDYVYITTVHDGEVSGYPATKAVQCSVCCPQ